MRMISEVAQESNKHDNVAVAQFKESYSWLDAQMSNDAPPVTKQLAEALVVADFPLYFARTLSRRVLDRYAYQTGSWKDYSIADTLPDYTQGDRFRFGETERLERRREKEEARATSFDEHDVHIAVEDYAKQLDFSRRILINDDLGAFDNFTQRLGDSARRFEDWFVSALYDNALTQATMVALGVTYAGVGRLTTANLAIGINAFLQRVDGGGNPIAVSPKYLVIPPILSLTANQILQSEKIAELATNGINPIRNSLQVRTDPYMAFAGANIPWYLFAAPTDIYTFPVVRLSGVPGPQLYAKAPDKLPMAVGGGLGAADWRLGSFLTGDIEIEIETTIGCRIDSLGALVGITDVNGFYYSSGTAP